MTSILTALNKVDFLHQDGIFMPMINDQRRNLFYKAILSECAGQNCIDIGFGTGLLSFAALDYGAKSITAYEMVDDIYEIGQHLIKALHLEDKITLHNRAFCADKEDVSNKVVFHEIVNSQIWGERLYTTIGNTNLNLIPSEYVMRVQSFEFDDSYSDVAVNLLGKKVFSPGIKFQKPFKNELQNVIDMWVETKEYHALENTASLSDYRSNATTIAEYSLIFTPNGKTLTINDKTGLHIVTPMDKIDLMIQSEKPQLLFCDFYIKHKGASLHLNSNCWGYPSIQFLVKPGVSKLTQNLLNGKLAINL